MIEEGIFSGLIALPTVSVKEAMHLIDKNAKGILYITDESIKLLGSVTDGDIRRWILKNGDISGTVGQMYFKSTKYIYEDEVGNADKVMERNLINSVPVVDFDLHIKKILFNDSYKGDYEKNDDSLANVPIIVMAGGKGTRLHPYTKILPKPLIPIGNIPILERILDRFHNHGANRFYLTVNYKKEMIKSYFADQKPPYKIIYYEEEVPLGTAGSIRLIQEKFDSPVIVTNCDILIHIDYHMLFKQHIENNNDMTIVSSLKNTSVPYGVLHTREGGLITSMEEKPQLSFFINTGMYVVDPEFLDWIPKDRVFHMTDLAEIMIKKGCQVGMYPISEDSFLDMGEFEEMKKMEERINAGNA